MVPFLLGPVGMGRQLSSFAVGDCYIMKKATVAIGQRMCLDVRNTVSNLILLFKFQGKTRAKYSEAFCLFFVYTICQLPNCHFPNDYKLNES